MDRWRKVRAFCVTVRRSGYWAWINSVNLACTALLAWSGFIWVHLHTSGPHQRKCITSTIQNACWTLAPLMPPRFWGWTKSWSALIQDFFSSNYLLMAFHLASSPREQSCRQKTVDLMVGAKDRQFDEWKTENLSGIWCSTPKPAPPLLVIRNRKWLLYYILSFNLLIMGNQPISFVIYQY